MTDILNSPSAASRFAASGVAAVNPRYANFISGALGMVDPQMFSATAEDDFFDPNSGFSRYRPYEVKDGMLVIPVKGTLLSDFPYQLGTWATGYEYIKRAVARGMSDPGVRKIALMVDSPGGEVQDCFPLADFLATASKVKPIRAFAKSAYSAAYALSSAAGKIIVEPVTGGVGSIGVVTAHVDYSKRLEQDGIKLTYIFFGKHKVDGNPYEPLSEDAQKRIQAEIDKLGETFVSRVAKNRGMDEAAVRATEALTYVAEEGVAVGLADAVGSLEDALVEFKAETPNPNKERTSDMSKTPEAAASSIDQAALEAASVEARAAGKAEGLAEGAKATRELISAIMALDESKGREATAMAYAMQDGATVEGAKVILGSIPMAVAPAASSQHTSPALFNAAMGKDNPELGAGAGAEADANDPKTVSARIGASYRKVAGLPAQK